MIEEVSATAEADPVRRASERYIEEFAMDALEEGQVAIIWDWSTHRYVHVSRPTRWGQAHFVASPPN